MQKGNIGVFDSGLGGLWILKHLQESLPEYNYIFFGDQANVPYGTKTIPELFECTTKVLAFLYGEKNCSAVLLACNTVSSTIYPQLRAWVEKEYPGRYVFGIIRPTIEAIPPASDIALFATLRTVESHVFKTLLQEKNAQSATVEVALPQLCTLIENAGDATGYIASFSNEVPKTTKIGVLACTHYGIVRQDFIKAFPGITTWISQEEIIPEFFKKYLVEKKEFTQKLATDSRIEIYVSKENHVFDTRLSLWFGSKMHPVIISL
jgi:glutamate racemase